MKTPLHRKRDDQPRAVVAVCLGRDRRSQKSIKVLVLLTRRREVHRHRRDKGPDLANGRYGQ